MAQDIDDYPPWPECNHLARDAAMQADIERVDLSYRYADIAVTPPLTLPLTQEDLADASELTPVHVNRMLQRMRKEGLIEMANGQLFVPDVGALRQRCGFEPDYFHLKISNDYPSDRPEHFTDAPIEFM